MWETHPRTGLPTSSLRRNSLPSQARGSSGVPEGPALGAPGRRARRGASISASARVRSGGGPLRGWPRITTAPPSSTWGIESERKV